MSQQELTLVHYKSLLLPPGQATGSGESQRNPFSDSFSYFCGPAQTVKSVLIGLVGYLFCYVNLKVHKEIYVKYNVWSSSLGYRR